MRVGEGGGGGEGWVWMLKIALLFMLYQLMHRLHLSYLLNRID